MRVIVGLDNVARMFAGLGRRFADSGLQVEPREVNGQPGAVFRDASDRVINVLALDVYDGRIQVVRSVINPVSLQHLGPVADAWAFNARRRPTPAADRTGCTLSAAAATIDDAQRDVETMPQGTPGCPPLEEENET